MKTVFAYLFILSIFCSIYTSAQINSYNWPSVSNVQLIASSSSVSISWVADNEDKGMYYEVERNINGTGFKTAVVVLGGIETEKNYTYQFRDKLNSKHTIIYRIKQIKQDGSYRIVAERTL